MSMSVRDTNLLNDNLFDRPAHIPAWLLQENTCVVGVFTSRAIAMHSVRDQYPNEIFEWKREGDVWYVLTKFGYWILKPIVLNQRII